MILNEAWSRGYCQKLKLVDILPRCETLPVKFSTSLMQASSLTVSQIREVLGAHGLSVLLKQRPVLVATAQDLNREPLSLSLAGLARCQKNPDYAVENSQGEYGALLDHKTLQHGDLWKSTFLPCLGAYLAHYASLGDGSREARKVALDMLEALRRDQDSRAVDLWLAGLDRGLFLATPPPPRRLRQEQSLDHFTEDHKRLLSQARGSKDHWVAAMPEEGIWQGLPDWAKEGLH